MCIMYTYYPSPHAVKRLTECDIKKSSKKHDQACLYIYMTRIRVSTVQNFCVFFKFMVFIESKTTHIINCITLQHLFVFMLQLCWLCKSVTCYSVEQCPHHIYPYSTGVFLNCFFLHDGVILIAIIRNENGGMQVGLAQLRRLTHVLISYATFFCCTVCFHEKS